MTYCNRVSIHVFPVGSERVVVGVSRQLQDGFPLDVHEERLAPRHFKSRGCEIHADQLLLVAEH